MGKVSVLGMTLDAGPSGFSTKTQFQTSAEVCG